MPRLRPRRTIHSILHELPVRALNTFEERQSLCDYIGYAANPDIRMQLWDITPVKQDEFTVTGYVTNPFSLKALERAAEECRTTCHTGQVQILPEPVSEKKQFGMITAPECPVVDAVPPSEQLDSVLFGNTLVLLRIEEKHTLVYSPNGYVGWVDNQQYQAMSLDEWYVKQKTSHALFLNEFSQNGTSIPMGTELPLTADDLIKLPNGNVLSADIQNQQIQVSDNQEKRETLLSVAKSLLGTPYVWGGVSKFGTDCSGFVRYVYKSIEILLPRDADQQFLAGTICALPGKLEAIQTGDLLFFAGDYGGIKHVGMAIDPNTFIHASTKPGVIISTWKDEPDLAGKFMIAKRIVR